MALFSCGCEYCSIMILSDRDIAEHLDEGDIVIEPLDDDEWQIQPASVDMRLSNEFLVFNAPKTPVIRPSEVDVDDFVDEIYIEDDEEFVLHPGEFVLGQTREWVEVPNDLLGTVQGRSSIGRLAVIVHATAGIVDPGYKGRITLELSNLGKAPVALKPGMRLMQMMFLELSSPAKVSYGEERGSKYQGQEMPRASAIQDDPEYKNK